MARSMTLWFSYQLVMMNEKAASHGLDGTKLFPKQNFVKY